MFQDCVIPVNGSGSLEYLTPQSTTISSAANVTVTFEKDIKILFSVLRVNSNVGGYIDVWDADYGTRAETSTGILVSVSGKNATFHSNWSTSYTLDVYAYG